MRLHHLAFRSADVPRLVAFYTNIFGFAFAKGRDRSPAPSGSIRAETSTGSTWLALGDSALLMLEAAAPEEPCIPHGSLECVVFATTVAGRIEFRAQCIKNAIPLDGETAFTTYVRDPDGRRVGVSHYPEPAEQS